MHELKVKLKFTQVQNAEQMNNYFTLIMQSDFAHRFSDYLFIEIRIDKFVFGYRSN